MWKFLEKQPFFQADLAGLGKYRTGGFGRIGVYRVKEAAITHLRLDNTGAWVIEVYPLLLCNRMSEHVDLYIKLKLRMFSFT